jgi:hypothetical protein
MKIMLLPVFLLIGRIACAQSNNLVGIIIDADSKAPVGNCSVFISNTKWGTTTDETGRFAIQDIPGYYMLRLVVSSVGYETFIYDFSTQQLPLNLSISLNKKIVDMTNVNIVPYEPNGWQRWGFVFIRNFLGGSDNAYDCQIENTSTIKFRNNKKENTLEAEADAVLIIRNYHLGYLIRYKLEKFQYNYKTLQVSYSGYPLFQEMEPNEHLWPKFRWERERTYHGSLMHFIRSLYTKSLAEEGFEVRRTMQVLTNDTVWNNRKSGHKFYCYDSTGHKVKPPYLLRRVWKDSLYSSAMPADSLVFNGTNNERNVFSFDNSLAVYYLKEKEPQNYRFSIHSSEDGDFQFSRFTILNKEKKIFIESNGSYDPGFELLVEGYLGWEKVGDFLPLDYTPDDNNK